ncbi:MAG TPA: NAD(P)-dependent oxidoreductase [Candidatus Lachnoclostridium pullistercoris]|uniref:NAD(P)-dependent oxidoreductase n=1 Tax=Candidatus Lachnoclostridium pullistercoris TaxID=2838632 RepID=A0A9D2T5P3_9FIRM|nr:NAD(P)-dependent oxidoreductase [Candidatus Lachnoclostridium pullistercoris]
MDVIVTGGTSFIGLAVTEMLLSRGNRVWTVVRPGSPNRNKLPVHKNLRILDLGLEEMARLPEAARNAGWGSGEPAGQKSGEPAGRKSGESAGPVFLHMAWDGVGSAGRSDRAVQEKNIRCSLEAVRAAAALSCRRFVFSGSQAEYGICRELTAEDHPCHPVSEYGRAKLEFGRQAEELCRKCSMKYIHARIFSVYGPGDHPWSLVSSCLAAFSAGGHMELGECTQKWNFLYIEDMAAAMAALLETEDLPAGIYNVAGDDTRVLREFVEEMYSCCGRNGDYVYGKRPPNAEGPASLLPDISRLEERTGWRPKVSFREGILKTLAAAGEKKEQGGNK